MRQAAATLIHFSFLSLDPWLLCPSPALLHPQIPHKDLKELKDMQRGKWEKRYKPAVWQAVSCEEQRLVDEKARAKAEQRRREAAAAAKAKADQKRREADEKARKAADKAARKKEDGARKGGSKLSLVTPGSVAALGERLLGAGGGKQGPVGEGVELVGFDGDVDSCDDSTSQSASYSSSEDDDDYDFECEGGQPLGEGAEWGSPSHVPLSSRAVGEGSEKAGQDAVGSRSKKVQEGDKEEKEEQEQEDLYIVEGMERVPIVATSVDGK